MKQVTGKALARAVQDCGWTCVRIKGSHHIFTKEGRPERIVIPIHGNKTLKIGLLHALMKIADLSEEDI
ncbi:MAG: type II toxin-antitoxin system HicA family toxin [Verrucomicrobia bacterium]|nr:type II toxin-antitoxin system HicA family toxin [Verrucomicrobiota bacterium]